MKNIPDTKYIYFDKRNGTYVITKRVMNKPYNFGSYKSLEDAKQARNYFENNGWGKCLDERLKFSYKQPEYLVWIKSKKVWQIRKKINGKLVIFGQFKRIEDAEDEVKLLKKWNWNIQDICDLQVEGTHMFTMR